MGQGGGTSWELFGMRVGWEEEEEEEDRDILGSIFGWGAGGGGGVHKWEKRGERRNK